MPDIITAEQAAEYLQVNVLYIYRLCKKKRIKAIKIGRGWRINSHSLKQFAGVEEDDA